MSSDRQMALRDERGTELIPPIAPREVSIAEVLERAISDPATDPARLEKFMDLYERVRAREAKVAYESSLVDMKPKLPVIARNGKIEVREKDRQSGKRDGDIIQSSPYARYEDIDEAITPILHEHGFVITFRSGVLPDGKVTVTGVLSHKQGHSEETTVPLPHDSSGSKNPVQAIGSSLSYGRRYAATLLLNIRTKGEDDDGRKAGAEDPLTDRQLEILREMIERSGANIEKFCEHMKAADLPSIMQRDFDKAKEALNLKLAKGAHK